MGYDVRPSFLQNAITGQILMLAGCRPSSRKPLGAVRYQSQRYGQAELPSKVDLRPHMTRVEDQAQLNSCAANAIAGAYEYLAKRAHGDADDMSRLFLYYNARRIDGIQGDRGVSLTGSIDALYEAGVCREKTWPYHEEYVNRRPPQRAYREGERFRLKQAQRIQTDLFEMKHCLAEGYPIVFGMALFDSFDRAARNGKVPMPRRGRDTGRSSHGLHAMLAVGYSDANQAFVVRNSWGERWGDGGYCYVPYGYMANPEYVFEAWTIRALDDLDLAEDDWDDSDSGFFEEDEDAQEWSDDDWSDDETEWESVPYDEVFDEPHYNDDLMNIFFNVLFETDTPQWSEGGSWAGEIQSGILEHLLADDDDEWDDEEWSEDDEWADDEETFDAYEDGYEEEYGPLDHDTYEDEPSNAPTGQDIAVSVLGALVEALVDDQPASSEDEWSDEDEWVEDGDDEWTDEEEW